MQPTTLVQRVADARLMRSALGGPVKGSLTLMGVIDTGRHLLECRPSQRRMWVPWSLLFTFGALFGQGQVGEAQAFNAAYVSLGGGGATGGTGDTLESTFAGFRLVAGVSAKLGPVLIDVLPVDFLYDPDFSSPFYRDDFANGQSRCRDSRTGQFADDSQCSSRVTRSVVLDVAILIPRTPVTVGLGHRIVGSNMADSWFATAGVGWFPAKGIFGFSARVEVGSSHRGWLAMTAIRFAGK